MGRCNRHGAQGTRPIEFGISAKRGGGGKGRSGVAGWLGWSWPAPFSGTMWEYRQSDGWLTDATGTKVAQGYSGAGVGKNSPEMQNVHNVGPIPCGVYTVGAPVDTVKHGPYALPLTPEPTNEMFGRSEFLCHGDAIRFPGTASEGCIIIPRFARERLRESGGQLEVVSGKAMEMVTDVEL